MKRTVLLLLALLTYVGVIPAGASPVPMPPELWLMDADGSDHRAISTTEQDRRVVTDQSWSPDGTQIAFFQGDTLIVHSVADGSSRVVAQIDAGQWIAWAPDGQWIAVSLFSGTPRGVFLIRPDGSDLHHVGPDAQASGLAWAADSSRLAASFFSDPGSPPFLATVALDGSHQVVATDAGYAAPDWDPSGTELAYVDQVSRLSIVRADGSVSKITPEQTAFGQPVWSPDGTRIAYRSNRGLAIISPDGSGKVTVLEHADRPQWDPSGAALAVQVQGDIYRVNSDGTGATDLTNSDDREDFAPRWSPDGTKIAYLSSVRTFPPDETIERSISLRQRRHLILRGVVRDLGQPSFTCLATPTAILIQRREAGSWHTIRRVSADEDGSFRSRVADRPGEYRALARRKTFSQPGPGHQVTCTRARSRTVMHRH